jgi:hypothetical protein
MLVKNCGFTDTRLARKSKQRKEGARMGASQLFHTWLDHQPGLAQQWFRLLGAGQSLYFQPDLQNNIYCLD